MNDDKQTKPRSITALEEEWSNLICGDGHDGHGQEARGAEVANRLVNEAAPHDLRTRITEVNNVKVSNDRCLIHCTMFIQTLGDDAKDETETNICKSEGWVHPSLASIYYPAEVIKEMQNQMSDLDHKAEWTKLDILCNTLIEVLKGPLHRKRGDINLGDRIREIDWGRLPQALPETYVKAKAAAEHAVGIAAVTNAATARTA